MLQSAQLVLEQWVSLLAYFDMKQTYAEFSSQKFEYDPSWIFLMNFFGKIAKAFKPLTIFANKLYHSTRF